MAQLKVLAVLLMVVVTVECLSFQGCFRGDIKAFEESYDSIYNINTNCAEYCRNRGFVIAATKGSRCSCAQTLPLPQLARPEEASSSGPGSECHERCPGSRNSGQCYGDECCGGQNAYTVYVTGEIDAQLQIVRRMRQNVLADKRYFYTRYFRFMETTGYRMDISGRVLRVTKNENFIEDCMDKCLMLWNCDGYSWNIQTRECLLWENSKIGDQDKNWISNIRYYGFIRNRKTALNSGASPIKTINFQYFFDECEEECIRTDGCTGYTWSDYDLWCTLYKGATGFHNHGKVNYNAAFLNQVNTNNAFVTSHATMINKDGDIYHRVCKARIDWDDEQCYVTDVAPKDDFYLDVLVVSNQLEHLFGGALEPYGTATEIDNKEGSTGAKSKHTYEYAYSSSTTYTTESGTSTSTKTSESTKITDKQMKESMTKEFFSEGHSDTQEFKYSESKTFEMIVPAQCEGIMEVFTQSYNLQVKWRADMVTEGYANLELDDRQRRLHVSEVLVYEQRKIYTFGTTDHGERNKMVAITKITDKDGNIVSETNQ